VRDALDVLSGGVPDDLLGAVVLFELLAHVCLDASREAPSLGLILVAGVSLSLRQAGPVSLIALVAIALQLAADRGFTAADQARQSGPENASFSARRKCGTLAPASTVSRCGAL